jgi:large subunit ribosomal protein L21
MYAVIANGGKQYKVAENQIITLEQMDVEPGNAVEFDKILLLFDGGNITVGTPFVKEASVKGEVIKHSRAKKIIVTKFRRRKHHMKRMGHRQNCTVIKITMIENTQKQNSNDKEGQYDGA